MVERVKKPKRETVCIGVYVSKEQHDNLKHYSKISEQVHGVKYTLSDIVRLAIKEFFDRNEIK